jgi:hypothetical protein
VAADCSQFNFCRIRPIAALAGWGESFYHFVREATRRQLSRGNSSATIFCFFHAERAILPWLNC